MEEEKIKVVVRRAPPPEIAITTIDEGEVKNE